MNIALNDSVQNEETLDTEKKVILTDEQVDQVVDTLEGFRSDESKFVESLPSNNGVEERESPEEEELKEEIVQEIYDKSGNKYILPMDQLNFGDEEDDLDKLLKMDDDQIKALDIVLSEDRVKESLSVMIPGITQEDIVSFLKSLDRYRRGEKFSYYQDLSDSFKNKIDSTLGPNIGKGIKRNDIRNYFVSNLFDQIIQDNYFDTAFIDLEKSINREMNKATGEMKKDFTEYNIQNRNVVDRIEKQIEIIKDTNPEQAEKLLGFSNSFKEAYTYNKFLEAVKNGRCRAKKIEIEKIERELKSFNDKYKNTKFTIQSIETIYPVLLDTFDKEYSVETIKRFIIAFIRYTRNMNPDTLNDHVFMYYFIKNIDNMVFYDVNNEEDSLFYSNLKNKIKETFDSIILIEENIAKNNSKKGN